MTQPGTAAARPLDAALPELASVYWRPRVSDRSLTRTGRIWTTITVAHTVPFIAVAGLLLVLNPVTAAVALMAIAQAWIIPELYAARGANVLRSRALAEDQAARVSAGLLGDLLGHEPRDLHRATGLVLERGTLGVWLVAEAGAVLVRPGGRRVHCYCVKVTAPELPAGDRIAHLLLALRTDETGFATVANLAFSGASWRLRRRVKGPARAALASARRAARPTR